MKKIFLLIAVALLVSNNIKAQYDIVSNNGQTITACTGYFTCGNYAANQNLTITFASTGFPNTHISISFISFNVHYSDTLYVYDGPNITSPLIGKYNNNNPLSGGQNMVQASAGNTSGRLTFKFVTDGSNQSTGWNSGIICTKPCQKIIAAFDTILTTPHPNDSNYIDICLH
ncbi:MAG: CUB domain-containing protein [Bacteroidetes bacterium]|nr:CUB domain-containing protein [Bacteroidota bacterium]